MPLTPEELQALLYKKRKRTKDIRPSYIKQLENPEELESERLERIRAKYPLRQQIGPVRWYDTEAACAKRGCTTLTSITVQGIRYCPTHALTILNELCLKAGIIS